MPSKLETKTTYSLMPSFFRRSPIACSIWALSPLLSTPAWSVTLPETPKGGPARAGPLPARSRAAVRPRTTGSRRTLGPPMRVGVLQERPDSTHEQRPPGVPPPPPGEGQRPRRPPFRGDARVRARPAPRRRAAARDGPPHGGLGGGQPRRRPVLRGVPAVPAPARRPLRGQHRRRRLPGLPLAPEPLRRPHRRDGRGPARVPRLPRADADLLPAGAGLRTAGKAARPLGVPRRRRHRPGVRSPSGGSSQACEGRGPVRRLV